MKEVPDQPIAEEEEIDLSLPPSIWARIMSPINTSVRIRRRKTAYRVRVFVCGHRTPKMFR